MFVTRPAEHLAQQCELGAARLRIGFAERAPARLSSERGLRFDGEVIGRNVFRLQFEGLFEVVAPLFARHLRHSVNQVDAQVAEPGPACGLHRFDRRAGVVAAVHPLQVAVEERLDAYAEAVGPFAAQGCEVG